MVVCGTRPEAIKMAPLVKRLGTQNEFQTVLCSTGQHREMLDQVMSLFDLQPEIVLGIMRTGNLLSPWPEEGNRKLTGALAAHHCAPTPSLRQNLLAEGVDDSIITVTGNTVINALFDVVNQLENNPSLRDSLWMRLSKRLP